MAWLEKIAEKLNVSTKTLLIILCSIAVLLIAAIVLGLIFWQDIRFHFQVGRYREGDAITIRYAFYDEKSTSLLEDGVVLPEVVTEDAGPITCMGEQKDCEVSFFYQEDGMPLSLIAMVANDQSGYPVSLQGVSLQFTDYQPYTAVNVGLGRGLDLGGSTQFDDRLQLMQKGDEIEFLGAEEWLANLENPQKIEDRYFFVNLEKQYPTEQDLLSMQADELEYLTIHLPFSGEMLPGWYAFEVSLQYETPEGMAYRTKPQVMNVLVPETVNYFLYETEDDTTSVGAQYFLQYQPFTSQLLAKNLDVVPSSKFTMIMDTSSQEAEQIFPVGFWKYDLVTGMGEEIFPSSSTSSLRGSGTFSNSGWQQVNLTPDYTWSLYDFKTDSTLLLDNTEHYGSPSWSPDDNRISFFHINEKNVIGIYDVENQKMDEIALDINGEIEDMNWYSNSTLLLMVQDGSITRFHRYHLDNDLLELIHNVTDIDTDEFVVTSQGQIVVVNDDFGITVPGKKYIYSLKFGNAGVDGWYCEWLSDEFVALCSTGGNVYLVDQINETTEKLLETGGLAAFEKFGSEGLAVITLTDDVHLFDVSGKEVGTFHIDGISEQHWLGIHFTFLEQ